MAEAGSKLDAIGLEKEHMGQIHVALFVRFVEGRDWGAANGLEALYVLKLEVEGDDG